MKKIIVVLCLLINILSCKNSTNSESDNQINESSISERNEKLITATKNVEGIYNADVKDDILTVQVILITKKEAQKMANGIFQMIKKYEDNAHIKTVIVCDLDFKLLGYAGK